VQVILIVIQSVLNLVIYIFLSLQLSVLRIAIRSEGTAENQENAGTVIIYLNYSGIKMLTEKHL